METIKSLKEISFDTIFEAFNKAFEDYEMQLNKEELQAMLNRRGFVPELSFAAFVNNKIVGFTLNGIGEFNGVKTAYDTGTGTLKEYQGQGLAGRIFAYSIPFLKNAGVVQYLLEVLQHNTKAVSVYKNLGFNVSREFNYYVQKNGDSQLCTKVLPLDYNIKQFDLAKNRSVIDFCDFNPSWQNSFEAVLRKPDDFICLGVYKQQSILGYCIFEPTSGDITQIAVDKNYRRKGIASNIINEALKFNRNSSFKIINTDVDCNSITAFLQSNSIPPNGKQFEMIKQL